MVTLSNYTAPIDLDSVFHKEENVTTNVDNSEVGKGTLYVTEGFVLWLNSSDEGLRFEYKQISLHAVSRDPSSFPRAHLLVHYDAKLPGMEDSEEEDDDEEENGYIDTSSQNTLVEVRFVPENTDSLDAIFSAMTTCQSFHPDENDSALSDDDMYNDAENDNGDDGFYEGPDGLANLTPEAQETYRRLNQMLEVGQGDGPVIDISAQTSQLRIVNGHGGEGDKEEEQFDDADHMDQ